jgi:hypothetical protein
MQFAADIIAGFSRPYGDFSPDSDVAHDLPKGIL